MFKNSNFPALLFAFGLTCANAGANAAIDYANWFDSGINVAYNQHSLGNHQITLNWSSDSYGHGGGGGEFRVESVYNPAGGSPVITYTDKEGTSRLFKTFCLEQGEHVYLSTPYFVSVDNAAYFGGNISPDLDNNNTPGNPNDDFYKDILNSSTKLLYGRYFDGTLGNAVSGFAYNDNASADILQQTIWALEDNVAAPPLLGTGLFHDLYYYATGLAAQADRAKYENLVGVMNLWILSDSLDSPATAAQSQLIWLGNPSQALPPAPESASLAIWALGIAATAAYRQRKRLISTH